MLLLVWNLSDGVKFFAFIGLGVANGPTNLIVPWLAEAFSHVLEARSAAIAILNVGWVVINLVVPLVAWPTSASPQFKGGYIWSVIMSVIELILLPLPVYLLRREKKIGIDYRNKAWAEAEVGVEDVFSTDEDKLEDQSGGSDEMEQERDVKVNETSVLELEINDVKIT